MAQDPPTKRSLPPVPSALGGADTKTPAFGLRRPSPLREALDGKPPDDFGPIRVRKKEVDPLAEPEREEEEAPVPDYSQPENTKKLTLTGETMRVNLERAARSLQEEVPEVAIPVLWGGAPAAPGRLAAPSRSSSLSLPAPFRIFLLLVFLVSLLGTGIITVTLLAEEPAPKTSFR